MATGLCEVTMQGQTKEQGPAKFTLKAICVEMQFMQRKTISKVKMETVVELKLWNTREVARCKVNPEQ